MCHCWVQKSKNSFGDSSLLDAARFELEQMGFTMHGAHKFLPYLLMSEGFITQAEFSETQYKDINIGINEAKNLGQNDIGQAVIVKGGDIIAREDNQGTNYMIKNFGEEGAVLVKMCKPQQDKDLDLPTIGFSTVQACIDQNMAGIVAEAGASLFVERDKALSLANENGLFIYGGVENATDNT